MALHLIYIYSGNLLAPGIHGIEVTKLGIEDISYKEAVKDIVERQNREYREREAQRIAEENARIEAELAAQLEAEEKAAAEAYKE